MCAHLNHQGKLMNTHEDETRAKFEEHIKAEFNATFSTCRGTLVRNADGTYVWRNIQERWLGWKAALSVETVSRDFAFEAVRQKLTALPRFSFIYAAGVRRVPDSSGNWIEFAAAHALFDPVAVDAALANPPTVPK